MSIREIMFRARRKADRGCVLLFRAAKLVAVGAHAMGNYGRTSLYLLGDLVTVGQ
jgi:hypothetical protein